ncbi:MAG: hypothetical protein AAB388_04780 [Patescibacteria group bacterium]
MSRETTVFLLGMLLTIVPFLGIPLLWRQYLIVGIGIVLVLVGYALRRKVFLSRIDKGNGERGTDSFTETTNAHVDDRTIE